MLGKPSWFKRRKYSGWGMSPSTWQGWAYIAGIIAVVLLIQYIPMGGLENAAGGQIRTIITIIVVGIIAIDTVHIMAHLPMDERDRMHEAIAERNALWAIIAALAAGVGWQAATSALNKTLQVDPVIIAALVVGLIAKAVTNIYLDKKN